MIGSALNLRSSLFLALLLSHEITSLPLESKIRYRPADPSIRETLALSFTLAKQGMNPFGIQTERFLIATNNKNERVGMAQLRPLGPVQSSWNFNQKQVNEELWADLESDPTLFPNGWASLPWTREYRDYAKMADKKRKQRETMESLEEKRQLWELASVFVDDAYRRQGIGASLVQGLLDRLVRFYGTQSLENVYLLTLANKVTWYEQFGFEVELSEDIPKEMELEVAAGNLITKMMGERLCCMRGKSKL